MSRTAKIVLVPNVDSDVKEMDAATEHLFEYLIAGGVETVSRARLDSPPGAKAGVGFDPATIFVTLATSGGVLTTLIGALQAWLGSRKNALTIEIGGDKVTLTGSTEATTRALIKNWIDRHQ